MSDPSLNMFYSGDLLKSVVSAWSGAKLALCSVLATRWFKMFYLKMYCQINSMGLIKGMICLICQFYPVIVGIYFGNKETEMFSEVTLLSIK